MSNKSKNIITFYSYKGGTGRSMMLSNVAWILASQGMKVLVVDWDLEAPGLHHYFSPFILDRKLEHSDGVIDSILNYATQTLRPISGDEQVDEDWYKPYSNIVNYAISLDWKFEKKGHIDFVPSGRQISTYASTVNSFDWKNFYDRLGGGAFLESMKEYMGEEYDYVLIDSRTGVSDTASICTVQLPEIVVVLFTLNNQSIDGAAKICESILEQDPEKILFPVISRVDPAEHDKLKYRRRKIRNTFDGFLAHLKPDAKDKYWANVEIPYVPYYVYEEVLATLADSTGNKNTVLSSSESLVYYLTGGKIRNLHEEKNEVKDQLKRLYETQSLPTVSEEIETTKDGEARVPVWTFHDETQASLRRAQELNTVTRFRIFISSPGDVRDERDTLEHLIKTDLQQLLEAQYNVYLTPLRWESFVAPSMGEVQSNLFKELGEYDIFVGVFWKRFGSPTSNYESGSEAEFRNALTRWEEDNSRPVLMYFCNRPFVPKPEEFSQMSAAFAFREKLKNTGLYSTYEDIDEFKSLVKNHLFKTIVNLIGDPNVLGNFSSTAVLSTPESKPRYLKALRRDCLQIPLTVLGEDISSSRAVTLDQVYVSLNTTSASSNVTNAVQKHKYNETISVLEAISRGDQIVLLGGPGSGKSSFLKYLIANLAESELNGSEALLPDSKGLLPVLIVLRDLVSRLIVAELPNSHNKRRAFLANLIVEQAIEGAHILQTPDLAEGIRQAFVEGNVFLVLDGLDEAPFDTRMLVREMVGAALNQFNISRIIVTCRTRSYSGESVFKGAETFTLAELDEDQIRAFVESWYLAQFEINRIKESEREERSNDLISVATRTSLLSLVRNPMLLTTLTIIHQQEAVLSKERVKLYEKSVDLLLRRWQQEKVALSIELGAFIDSRDELMRAIMERLAFEAHKAGVGDEAADLPRMETITLLSNPEYLGHESLASQFLDYVDLRSGLLQGRGGTFERPTVYSFPHRTFQEYLAGCYIIGARGSASRLRELADEGEFWSEAVLLGTEDMLFNRGSYGKNHLLNLASQLSQRQPPQTESESRLILWAGKMIDVVGVDVVEQDPGDIESGKNLLTRLRHQFVGLLSNNSLPPVERAEAGLILARLGDPREE